MCTLKMYLCNRERKIVFVKCELCKCVWLSKSLQMEIERERESLRMRVRERNGVE